MSAAWGGQFFLRRRQFGHRNQRAGLGQAVDLRHMKAQRVHVGDGAGVGRAACRRHANGARHRAGVGGVGQHGQHRGRGAQVGHAVLLNGGVGGVGTHGRQRHMGRPHTEGTPDPAPAVGVEVGEGVQINRVLVGLEVVQRLDGVEHGRAVRQHHAFGVGGRAGREVDGDGVVLVAHRNRQRRAVLRGEAGLEILPGLTAHHPDLGALFGGDLTHFVVQRLVCQQQFHLGVAQLKGVFIRRQAGIERHQHAARPGHRRVGQQAAVRVGRQHRHMLPAVPRRLHGAGESENALAPLGVGKTRAARFDDGGVVGVEFQTTANEVQGSQGRVHGQNLQQTNGR